MADSERLECPQAAVDHLELLSNRETRVRRLRDVHPSGRRDYALHVGGENRNGREIARLELGSALGPARLERVHAIREVVATDVGARHPR